MEVVIVALMQAAANVIAKDGNLYRLRGTFQQNEGFQPNVVVDNEYDVNFFDIKFVSPFLLPESEPVIEKFEVKFFDFKMD